MCKSHENCDQLLVSKVEFNYQNSQQNVFLPTDPVFSIWVNFIKKVLTRNFSRNSESFKTICFFCNRKLRFFQKTGRYFFSVYLRSLTFFLLSVGFGFNFKIQNEEMSWHCFVLVFNDMYRKNFQSISFLFKDAEFLLEAVSQRKADIDLKGIDNEEFVSNKKKPGRKPGTRLVPLGPDGNPCPELKTDLDQLRKRLRLLYNVVTKHTQQDGRETAEMFVQLPSKEKYPVYYEYIKNPIDLKMIDRKIRCNEVSWLIYLIFQRYLPDLV